MDDLPSQEWLIDGVLPLGGLCVLFGAMRQYKTFIALHMARAVASGHDWMDRETRPGPVVYVIAEGRPDKIRDRLAAIRDFHGMGRGGLYSLPRPVQVCNPNELGNFTEALDAASIRPSLIVFDTLARCMAGRDENSARDMGDVVAGAQSLTERFGCTVLLVHHTGKDEGSSRGSYALVAAADTVIKATRDKDGTHVTLACEKQKDSGEFNPIYGLMVPHEGQLVIAVETAPKARTPRDKAQPPGCAKVLAALRDAPPEGLRHRGLETETGLAGASLSRAMEALLRSGEITHEDRYYRLSKEEQIPTAA